MKLQQLRQIIREEVRRTLNEGSLAAAAGVTGDEDVDSLKEYVGDLETYLIEIGKEKNIDWDWEKLGELVLNIISEAKMLGYDDKHY